MLIDLLTKKTTLVKVSDFDSLSSVVLHNGYIIKDENDILSWKLSNPNVDQVEFIITSNDSVRLSEITFDVLGGESNSSNDYKIYTSVDYINWYELPFVKDDKYLYRKAGDNYVNLSTGESVTGVEGAEYVFTRLNEFSNEMEYVYDNLEFKYIKFVFSNLTPSESNPIFFRVFEIIIEDFLTDALVEDELLTTKADMFYKQKIFEEKTLFPDLIKNFLRILEFNSDEKPLANILTTHYYINIFDKFQFVGNDFDGIGFDYIGYDLTVYDIGA